MKTLELRLTDAALAVCVFVSTPAPDASVVCVLFPPGGGRRVSTAFSELCVDCSCQTVASLGLSESE